MRRLLNPAIWSLVIVLLACAGAAYYAVHVHARNDRLTRSSLEALADQAASQLQSRFQLYEYGLRGARGVVMAVDGGGISHDRFARYAESRDLDREFPGSRGFGYIARVPAENVAGFVAQARREGLDHFGVHELAPNHGERFIIKFIEPEARNVAAIGLDIASEANRRQAALAAMNSGKATLTGPITLVQASGVRNRSMLFLLPVYRGTQLLAPAARKEACIGWVYSPLVTDEILADFEQAHGDYGFTLDDVSDPARPVQIFASRTHAAAAGHPLTRSRTFSIYGRRWRADIAARPGFTEALALPDPFWGAAWIAGSGALLAMVTFVALNSRRRRRRALAQRARLATIVEDSHDAIIGTTREGVVIEWNRAATSFFGYEAREAIGQPLVDLIVPMRLIDEDREIHRKVFAGESVATMESVRRHRDGSTLFVEISVSPIRDGRGQVVGVAKTLRDITERKEAQRKILELNVTLEEQVQRRTAELQSFSALQRAILANAGYAIIATDPQGIITLFNPAAENLLGYSAQELVGLQSIEMFHDPIEIVTRAGALETDLGIHVEPGFEALVAKAKRKPDVNEWTYVGKHGERIPVLLNVSTLRREDGEIQGYLGIAVGLLERKRREAALEISERKMRGLFELSPLGIALTDAAGRLVEYNEAFRALTGYSDQELHALDYATLTPAEYAAQERNVARAIEQTGRYGPYDKHFVRKDGSRIPIRLNGVALRIGNRPHVWSIIEDITVQRLAEAAMVDAVAAAEATSKAKSDFLANMSHEIRTPMNAVLGMLQLLQRTGLDSKQRDYARKTEAAATTLLAILNDILDFSKIEAGRQTLEPHDFEFDRLMREIAVILSANVGDKDIEVMFDVDKRVPKWLIGDSLRLQQVLINLAGNAVKFTHFGEVVLAVKVVEQSPSHITLNFEVRDTGIGIAKDKLDSIFEGFSQAEASTTRRFGGSGLGLAISQRLVALMGGELKVDSELGKGSRFFFAVGFDIATPRLASSSSLIMERLRGLSTLVVDDNASAREMVMELAVSLGWSCEGAVDGEQALERIAAARAEQRGYDAIFMDWSMPGMDGWEVSRRIRERVGEASVPLIVMVTMHDREAIAERAAQEPALLDGFLIKPVTASMLLDAIADARAGRGFEARPAVAAATTAHAAGRLGGLFVLVVEDNLTNQQVARELLEEEGARVDVASSGGEALRLLAEGTGAYDAVLMDIQMPDMDGYAVTRRIRASPGFRTLPIIAMTANVLASDREACLAAGMNDHIGKPFDLNLLVERLLHWTGRGHAVALATGAATDAGPSGPSVPAEPVDWAPALARFGDNRRAYLAALARFPVAALAALREIEQALPAGQRDAVERQLHTLKGVAGTVGADRVARLAATLEQRLRDAGAEWSSVVALDQLRARIEEATSASRSLPAQIADPAAAATPALPLSRATLQEFASLLEASNLRSLDLFEDMQRQLASAHPDAHRRIEDALTRLDMQAALAACRDLLVAETGDRA